MTTLRAASWGAAVIVSVAAGTACAQDAVSELNGYVTVSSGYWRHGLAQTDSASVQLGIDYQHYTGFFAYARAMNVDYPQSYTGQRREVETSAYVGYHKRHPRWSWTTSLGRYLYPGTDGYEYGEISASVGFRDRVFYAVSYNDEYYSTGASALNQELSVSFPLPRNIEVGGAIGYFDMSDGAAEIEHWNLGVSKLVGRIALDLRYYDSDYSWRNYLGDPHADRYVLSASYALRRR